jgi:hypothetical protein
MWINLHHASHLIRRPLCPSIQHLLARYFREFYLAQFNCSMLPIYHQRLWVKDLWNNRDADFFMILVVIIVTIMVKTPDIVFIIFWVLLILVFVIYSMQELVLWQLVLVVQVLHALCLPQCFWQLERIFQIILKVRLTLVIWEEKGWARVF